MNNYSWFSQISFKQRIWLFATVAGMLAIIVVGILLDPSSESKKSINFNIDMSIRDIAPKLGVTGKALARELTLPLDVSKRKPLKVLGVAPEELQDRAAEDIFELSIQEAVKRFELKPGVYFAIGLSES